MGLLNAFALPPQYYYLGPLTHGPITRKPNHLLPRRRHPVVRVALSRVRATSARRSAWRCHMALRVMSHPRGSHAPRQLHRFCGDIKPLFAFFKGIKIKINFGKIQKNPKTSEICIFKNITHFQLKFSPLYHKFLHL